MRSYLFIQDPGFSALRRISPSEVPALFCIREVELPAPPSRRERLVAALAQVKGRLLASPATFGAACARAAPRLRDVDPAAVPR